MINTQLMELVKKIVENPEYQKEFAKCKTKQEMFDYCSSICSGYTQKEFDDFLSEMLKSVTSKESVPMSNQSLKNVSGGIFSELEYGICSDSFRNTSDNISTLKLFMQMFEKNLEQDNFGDMLQGTTEVLSKTYS